VTEQPAVSEIEVSQVVRTNGAKELARYLVEEISNGTLAVGIKLPAERELSERFNASRGAVRRVLGELKSRGLITQVVGSGTFVAAAPETTPRLRLARALGQSVLLS
jgi:DNA-binding GntR family transcriptional regulator